MAGDPVDFSPNHQLFSKTQIRHAARLIRAVKRPEFWSQTVDRMLETLRHHGTVDQLSFWAAQTLVRGHNSTRTEQEREDFVKAVAEIATKINRLLEANSMLPAGEEVVKPLFAAAMTALAFRGPTPEWLKSVQVGSTSDQKRHRAEDASIRPSKQGTTHGK